MDKEGFIEFMKSQKGWVSNDNNEFRIFHEDVEAAESEWYDSFQTSSYVLVDEIIFGYTETEDGHDEGGSDSTRYSSYESLIKNEF